MAECFQASWFFHISDLLVFFLSHLFPKKFCFPFVNRDLNTIFPPSTVSRREMASVGGLKEAVLVVMCPMSLVDDGQEQ